MKRFTLSVTLVLVALAAGLLLAASAQAGGYHKPKRHHPKPCYYNCGPVIPPVVIPPASTNGPEICKNGKRAVAGTDGHVPASGNTNDKCDWSEPARVPHPQYPNG